ncbi:hypothetical protein [Streptomyces murinus]|uniref:hypothetical protein n=1 Tax=Streptomyces murinus TaxID=33900 RepID=UPI002E1451C2|nr:hypothetical protein OG516_37450 [Streptomyces murinus]
MALMDLSRGYCYWPDPPCSTPVIREVNGAPLMNVQIAHIRAFEAGGPRAEPTWPGDVNSFANLLLLCEPHHKLIDGKYRDRYPVEELQSWKQRREGESLQRFKDARILSEEELSNAIAKAQADLLEQVGPALEEFRRFAPQMAELLDMLTTSLADPRVHGLGLSPDTVELMHTAAFRLRELPDTAPALAHAARDLVGVLERAPQIERVTAALKIQTM